MCVIREEMEINQPDSFDHLCEFWLLEREELGNFTALRNLEKLYPQYPQLSEWVMGFLEVEFIANQPEEELTEEEEKELEERSRRVVNSILAKQQLPPDDAEFWSHGL